MRRRNWRIIIAGFLLIVIALGFLLFILSIASQSTDPVALMKIAGTVVGVLGSVSLAMIVSGLIGKKV
jgi:hypothetical protein